MIDSLKKKEIFTCKFIQFLLLSEELCKIFNESIRNKEEGIVVKECDSKYKPNVRNGTNCYKIKAEVIFCIIFAYIVIIFCCYYK